MNIRMMNLKKFVLALLFVSAPASAYADAEIHEPFYAPDSGNMLLTARFGYSRAKLCPE